MALRMRGGGDEAAGGGSHIAEGTRDCLVEAPRVTCVFYQNSEIVRDVAEEMEARFA